MSTKILPSVLPMLLAACGSLWATVGNPSDVPTGWASGTTGGKGGTADTVSTAAEFATQLKKAGPHIIYVKGSLAGTFYLKQSNVSILGLPGAEIVGSFAAQGYGVDSITRNVIIRNLAVRPEGTCTGDEGDGTCETFGDAFTLKYIRKVWVDHVTIQDGLDGNLDITHGCDSITLSWIKQYYTRTGTAHQFANLIGHSDGNGSEDSLRLRITWHHSWWGTGIRERMPRVRFGKVHMYNNLFNSAAANYCLRVAYQANILAESNAFVGTKTPVDLYDNKTYLHGVITMKNNLYKNTTIAAASDTSSTGTSFTPPYAYTTDDASTLESKLTSATDGAGATLTWGSASAVASSPAGSGLRVLRRGEAGFRLSNPSAQNLSITVRDLAGRISTPTFAMAPGSEAALPASAGIRVLGIASDRGTETRLLAP